jgi:hypothetical protein
MPILAKKVKIADRYRQWSTTNLTYNSNTHGFVIEPTHSAVSCPIVGRTLSHPQNVLQQAGVNLEFIYKEQSLGRAMISLLMTICAVYCSAAMKSLLDHAAL